MALWNRRQAIIGVVLVVAIAGTLAVWTRPQLCTSMAGTANEIAQTPRDDRRIEQMAIWMSKGLTADQQTYSRLHSDISAIRGLAPNLSDVQYHPADDGKAVIVKLKPLARLLRAIGIYRQWDCLNEHYGLNSVDSIPLEGTVQLSFKGMYDMQKVADLYGMLSGVERAEPNRLVSTGTTRTLCATRVDSTLHYVLYEEGGAGRFHHFSSDRAGDVSALEVWELPESAGEAESTMPVWVARYWNQEACGG